MDDTFRLDLEDYDRPYIEDLLNTFVEDARRYGRTVVAIRMSKAMCKRLGIDPNPPRCSFGGVLVAVADTGFEGTIEMVLCPLH